MKELRIPIKSNSVLDLSEITIDFRGIIIGYKGTKPVGQILYCDESWYFIKDIEFAAIYSSEESGYLTDLIQNLVKDKKCDSFKVIEFES